MVAREDQKERISRFKVLLETSHLGRRKETKILRALFSALFFDSGHKATFLISINEIPGRESSSLRGKSQARTAICLKEHETKLTNRSEKCLKES
jgi:hypothetical protein